MPLYEFSCGDCRAQFESIQSFSATTNPACPACTSTSVSRLLSKPAIHFKGSGWYITDSKKSGKQSANGASKGNGDGAAEGASGNSADSTSEGSGDTGKKESSGSASESAPATTAASGEAKKSNSGGSSSTTNAGKQGAVSA